MKLEIDHNIVDRNVLFSEDAKRQKKLYKAYKRFVEFKIYEFNYEIHMIYFVLISIFLGFVGLMIPFIPLTFSAMTTFMLLTLYLNVYKWIMHVNVVYKMSNLSTEENDIVTTEIRKTLEGIKRY